MSRWPVGVILGVVLASVSLSQEDLQRGKIKKVDADKGTITITVNGKDMEFRVAEKTRLVDVDNKEIADRLKDKRVKVGAAVVFRTDPAETPATLRGMKLVGEGGGGPGGDIRRAKIKKIDLDKMVLTLTVNGKERDFTLTQDTNVLGATGKTLSERLKGFKEGSDIQFKAVKKDGKEVLVGLRLFTQGKEGPRTRITTDTSHLKPLPELGKDLYQKFQGGLYPEGKNERPATHEAAGLRLAGEVQPRDKDGKPSTDGKIVLLSVGMSNTSQVSQGFQAALREEKGRNPRLLFVNGAQGGMTAAAIQDSTTKSGKIYWTTVDKRLETAGVSKAQVQAAWIKQADGFPNEGFPDYARKLQKELANIVRVLHDRFPNLKIVYLSSRTYGGYATTRLNPEPYAYESGFAVKWLIAQQIEGDKALNYDEKKGQVKAPWLSWGPYLWANGKSKRADGFSYDESDYSGDGTHLTASGQRKTGGLLLKFLKTDSTAKSWFLAPS